MSISKGAVAGRKHNVVSEYREGLANVDPARTPLNEVLEDRALGEVYRTLFGEALEAYNAAQVEKGHPERQIADYLGHIMDGKQEKAVYEMVVQIGNQDTNPATDAGNRELSAEIYREFLDEFKKRFPALVVQQAAIHQDEATPHLHIAYVPVATGGKRGLSVRNSLRGSLKSMGYADLRDLNATLFEMLEGIAEERGVERLDVGCHRPRLTVEQFKAAQARGETLDAYDNDPKMVALLIEQQKTLRELVKVCEQQQETIDELTEHEPTLGNVLKFGSQMKEAHGKAIDGRSAVRRALDTARRRVGELQSMLLAMRVKAKDVILNAIPDGLRKARMEMPAKVRDALAASDAEIAKAASEREDAAAKIAELEFRVDDLRRTLESYREANRIAQEKELRRQFEREHESPAQSEQWAKAAARRTPRRGR